MADLEEKLERLRPQPTRAERLDERDAKIRCALTRYEGEPTNRAKALAADLAKASGLKDEASSDQLRAAQEIVRLNDGRALKWSQIRNIANGYRRE